MYTKSRAFHRGRRILAVAIATFGASCQDPVAPWPQPPLEAPKVSAITEWSASEPELVQRGVFRYDDAGRLATYEFGHVLSDGSHLITYRVLYEYSAGQVARTETHVRDGATFVHVGESEYSYDDAGRLTEELRRELDEGPSGEIREWITQYEYDAAGRMSAVVGSRERQIFSYDDRGNTSRVELQFDGVTQLVYEYSHHKSLNPLGAPVPHFDGVILITGFGDSPYNLSGWITREPGQPPASTASMTYDLDARQYPVRRVARVVNASHPDLIMEFISTFEYVDD